MGNKIDLSRRQVSTEIAKNYALEFGLLFYEISARKDHGIREVFTKIGTNTLFEILILKREKIIFFFKFILKLSYFVKILP